MKGNIIITTTSSINNAEIEKYIELVSTNVVVGTNFFSDFGASFVDLFGGLSDSYQNKLQKIYTIAIDNLKLKAVRIGANAVVGLKIDFDEISGKGKSMFMISALGTAVYIKDLHNTTNLNINEPNRFISNESLSLELTRRAIIKNIKNNILPNQDEWIYLLNNPISEISELILNCYILNKKISEYQRAEKSDLLFSYSQNFFKLLDTDFAIELLYSKLKSEPKIVLELIVGNQLFSPRHIIDLIKSNEVDLSIQCLLINSNSYIKNDLDLMFEIINLYDTLSENGKIENGKTMLGKSKDKYICPNGHINEVDNEFCSNYSCGQNIKGLTKFQVNEINKFKVKVDSLKSLFEFL